MLVTVIFSKANSTNLKLLMHRLKDYESQSGQKNNKENNAFYLYHKAAQDDIQMVEKYPGFHRGKFLLTYLGFLVGYEKKRKAHIEDLIKKI